MRDEINEAINEYVVGNYTQMQLVDCVEIICKKYMGKSLGAKGGNRTSYLYGSEHFKKIAKGWPKGKKRKQ